MTLLLGKKQEYGNINYSPACRPRPGDRCRPHR